MDLQYNANIPKQLTCENAIEPNYSQFDSAADIVKDATKWGLIDELRELLCRHCRATGGEKLRLARDLAYELAGANDRDRVVDVYLHACGVAEFGNVSLRSYAERHGCSHEQFRKEVLAMQMRLGLLPVPTSKIDVTKN